MNKKMGGVACGAVAIAMAMGAQGWAQDPVLDPIGAAIAEMVTRQRVMELPVRVIDPDGKPVAGAKVIPWALRSSQGHGHWRKGDERAELDPQQAVTDEAGAASVLYPYYRHLQERIRTISVSIHVDHPDYAYKSSLHIDVPLEIEGPRVIALAAGVRVEIRPWLDGKLANLDKLFAMWSDGRSWRQGTEPFKSPDGVLRIPAMPLGDNSILLVMLDGDRATHFSKITEFELTPGDEAQAFDIELPPSVRIQGVLSDNVPRPVANGRVKVWTLDPADAPDNRVTWFTWAPVEPDGTFTIDGWPQGEAIQLIALCDGYIATSGIAPASVKNPRDPEDDPFLRPQVFEPGGDEPIEVAMTPMSKCIVTTIDEDERPVAGVKVVSWPNVGWWNSGSQIYCYPLERGERLLREREHRYGIDGPYAQPFREETNGQGKATLELPVGRRRSLAISSDVYELPVFLGRRDVRIEVTGGEPTETVLRLQPRGTDRLGEWDKLAGVVFGCSTREGRRICALPGVQKQMQEFARRFREAKNQRDPQLLSEAYSAVAAAFSDVGDVQEAAKWRRKAAEQAEKVTAVGKSEG